MINPSRETIMNRNMKVHTSYYLLAALIITLGISTLTILHAEVIIDTPLQIFEEHRDWVQAADFSPDNKHIVTASEDGTIRLWECDTGECIDTLRSAGTHFTDVHYSPNGNNIVAATWKGIAIIWDMTDFEADTIMLSGHTNIARSAQFSSNGSQVITGSDDWTVRIWETGNGECIQTIEGHEDTVSCVSFSSDSQKLITSSWDGIVRIWDAKTYEYLDGVEFEGYKWRLTCVDMDPFRNYIAIASGSPTPSIINLETRECIFLEGHTGGIHSIQFSPDSHQVLTASFDHTAKIWSRHTGELLATIQAHDKQVFCARFDKTGTKVVTTSADKTAKIWEIPTLTPSVFVEKEPEEKPVEKWVKELVEELAIEAVDKA